MVVSRAEKRCVRMDTSDEEERDGHWANPSSPVSFRRPRTQAELRIVNKHCLRFPLLSSSASASPRRLQPLLLPSSGTSLLRSCHPSTTSTLLSSHHHLRSFCPPTTVSLHSVLAPSLSPPLTPASRLLPSLRPLTTSLHSVLPPPPLVPSYHLLTSTSLGFFPITLPSNRRLESFHTPMSMVELDAPSASILTSERNPCFQHRLTFVPGKIRISNADWCV